MIVADGMSDDGTREIILASDVPRFASADGRQSLVPLCRPVSMLRYGKRGDRSSSGWTLTRAMLRTTFVNVYKSLRKRLPTTSVALGSPRARGRIGKAIAAAFQSSFACGGARGHDPDYSGPVDTVYLGCWRREIFDRIGFFDEELVRNQDDEFNLRIVRSGGRVWQSVKIKSWYYSRESLRHLFAQYVQYGYWKARILQNTPCRHRCVI